jgi:dynein heavy chain
VTKLAAFVNDAQIFRIEPSKSYGASEWQEDLRTLFKSLGLDNKKMLFLLQDSDLKQEQFIEDVNNLLNVGELTNLFTDEDMEEINYEIETQLKKLKAKG